jgi:hypothetical protein
MATTQESISPDLARWLDRQHVFFVATAPLAAGGHVNCSPKGGGGFRVLGPSEVAYLDLTGSGAETIAHLKENGRIVFMFCAFEGPPKIVRLHGIGSVAEPGSPRYEELREQFEGRPEGRPLPIGALPNGARAIVTATITRVSDSCGYAVPRLDFVADRDALEKWSEKKGVDGLRQYREEKNASSIDGLPALRPR